jgi:hypothetical protein
LWKFKLPSVNILSMTNKMVLALDFDGTLVKHKYPNIGEDIGALPVLRRFIDEGWLFVLNTMRSGKTLDEAVNWCESKGILLFGVNENPTQKEWTQSPKVYAHLYIDDAAAGVPLIKDPGFGRPYIDWSKLEIWLEENGYLPTLLTSNKIGEN